MKLISIACAALLVSFLVGCSSPTPKSKKTPESEPAENVEFPRAQSTAPAKSGQNNLRIPYPNREVAVRTHDGKISSFKSDEKGLVRLPDGDLFDPEQLEILVCRSSAGCPAPTY
jgi:ABC-type uncharacterized transport system auxiliary subunit